MFGIRSVREKLRKKLLAAIKRGERDNHTLRAIAEQHFMGKCSFDVILGIFYRNEVNKALAQLRLEGKVLSAGKDWKPVEELTADDVSCIVARTQKRVHGELRSLEKLCHEHGFVNAAATAGASRSALSSSQEEEVLEPSQVQA